MLHVHANVHYKQQWKKKQVVRQSHLSSTYCQTHRYRNINYPMARH